LNTESPTPPTPRPLEVALLASVFVVAACGLVYELAAGALASYLLGDSVLQFSTIIGSYLFAMGIGSWLSRFFERQLPAHFLRIELMVALVGGALPALLFLANAYVPGAFRFLLYALVLLVGTLVGLEIPLVMRILRRNVALKELVSQVLTFDYLGALAVSLAFPLVLVPQLGLIRTGLLFGLMNAAVALWALWLFRHELRHVRSHAIACLAVLGALCAGFAGAKVGKASFAGANGDNADFQQADATGANFTGASLRASRADGSSQFAGAQLPGAQLERAAWGGAMLAGAALGGAVLDNADFSGVKAAGANFGRSSAKGARFDKADLSGADFTGVNLHKGSLRKANTQRALLRKANLYGVDFYDSAPTIASLEGSNIDQTILQVRKPVV